MQDVIDTLVLDPRPSEMDRETFIARFGGIYEHSPWIAAKLYDGGLQASHDTVDGLAAALARVVAEADDMAKMALICAHPDLAGRAAMAGTLTDASCSEQRGAGLDQCSFDEFERFQALNTAYKGKFGFPFILAVAGRTRAEILDVFESCIGRSRAAEFEEALRQIDRIARLRLEAMARR
jgi:2-oxo-4-hydroxy-4-carboxy-5-ureidoimidazoline decarboxylase